MTDFVRPEAGMGATVHIGSDSYAYTITAVSKINNGFTVQMQEDHASQGVGYDYYSNQVYVFFRNPKGAVRTFRFENAKPEKGWREIFKNKSGRFRLMKSTCRLAIGKRHKHSDPSF